MKTIREMMDQLDEISRRDVLKGAGAAALGVATGAKADWEREPDVTDSMTDEVISKWKNTSNDRKATLKFTHSPKSPSWNTRQLTLARNDGIWMQPQGSTGSAPGRLRVDNNKHFEIWFIWMVDQRMRVVLNSVKVVIAGQMYGPEYEEMVNQLLTAKQRILIDASSMGGGILEFRPQIREDQIEEVSPDALAKIDKLFDQ
jgi:hypothetical protein